MCMCDIGKEFAAGVGAKGNVPFLDGLELSIREVVSMTAESITDLDTVKAFANEAQNL